MKHTLACWISGVFLLSAVILPPATNILLGTSSMSLGVFLVSLVFTFSLLVFGIFLSPITVTSRHFYFVCALALIMLHGTTRLIRYDAFDYPRFLQSFLLLIVYMLGAFSLSRFFKELPQDQVRFSVRFVFFILLLSGVAGIWGISPFPRAELTKQVFFFREPSHFALSYPAFLLYMTIMAGKRTKIVLILASFILALLLQNLTLVLAIGLTAALAFSLRTWLFLLLCGVSLVVATGSKYYASRLVYSPGHSNLSTMAYLQGWERAYLDVIETSGVGVGFQQFGIVGSRGEILNDLAAIIGIDLNLLDGGSVGAKLIGEFGVFAIAALLLYLAYFTSAARRLHAFSATAGVHLQCKDVFFLSCFSMYCIDFFVRGIGFFSPSGFLFLASLFWFGINKAETDTAVPAVQQRLM